MPDSSPSDRSSVMQSKLRSRSNLAASLTEFAPVVAKPA